MNEFGKIQRLIESFQLPLSLPPSSLFMSPLSLSILFFLFYKNIQVNFFQTLKVKCIKPFHFSFVDLDITCVIIHLFIQQMLIKFLL